VLTSLTAIILAAILFLGFFLPSSLATAQLLQQQQEQQQQTTTIPPSSSLSITTIPPLTPQEQQQQNRLQSTIAATTRDLNETEKKVSGVVFTPRWSDVAWVNANSIAVLVAYCLPGEFADSGQEILGGFGLEVLESYAVDLPQGFMAWMAVVGNEDVQNRRFPAALGVICASDLNRADTRILSPQEQQQINNVISQFTTIQNTQITNIDQVINIINNVTEPTTEGQPLRAEIIITNTTRAINNATLYKFDADVTGGSPPYNYHWRWIGPFGGLTEGSNRSFGAFLQLIGTHTIILNVTDSKNQTASDTLQSTVGRTPTNDTGTTTGQPLTVEIIPNATSGFVQDRFELKTNVTGGIPPYFYDWDFDSTDLTSFACSYDAFIEGDNSCLMIFTNAQPLTHEVAVTVRDSVGKTASDTVQIVTRERLRGPDLGVLDNATVQGEGFRAGIIANATQVYTGSTIKFDASIRGGAPPYSYSWSSDLGLIDQDRSITLNFFEPGTFTYILTATDSNGQTASDSIQITVEERPGGVLLPPETGGEGQPPGGGLLPGIAPGGGEEEEQQPQAPPTVPEEGEPTTGSGEEEEDTGGAPPPDDTGEEGEGTPPSTTDEEPTTPPEGG